MCVSRNGFSHIEDAECSVYVCISRNGFSHIEDAEGSVYVCISRNGFSHIEDAECVPSVVNVGRYCLGPRSGAPLGRGGHPKRRGAALRAVA